MQAGKRGKMPEDIDNLKEQVKKEIDLLSPELIRIGKFLHKNPELAFQEFKAVEILTGLLKDNRFKIKKNIAGLPTAFMATYPFKVSSPSIAFLAEYDALPEIGHGCGHNLNGASSIGAALGIVRAFGTVPGRVIVIGTPAEERGGGKVALVKKGIFNGLDAALMVHLSNKTEVVKRSLAMMEFEIEFFGKAAHAAASPHLGINALDAMVAMYNNISLLRQQIREDARIHGIITNGGQAPNVIPDYTSARFIVRSLDKGYTNYLSERLKECATGAAKSTGAKVRVRLKEPVYEPFIPNYALAGIFAKNLKSLGVKVNQGPEDKGLGSSDIGNVSQVVPSIHPNLAICPPDVPHHSVAFARAAGSKRGLQGIITAAKALSMTGVDLLRNPEVLQEIKKEHRKLQIKP